MAKITYTATYGEITRSAQEGATLLPYVMERVGQHTGFCPGCEQHIPVMFADELYPHTTPAAQSCLGDKWSRCEGRQMGFRCQRAPHEEGKHERQPTRASGLWRWDDSEMRYDDHEFSTPTPVESTERTIVQLAIDLVELGGQRSRLLATGGSVGAVRETTISINTILAEIERRTSGSKE